MIEQLKGQIRVVAEARQKADEANHNLRSAQAIWEVANHILFEENELAKVQCGESEQLLRELTLQAYAETGNKAPAPGVGIRELTVLTYDGKVAFDWAKAHTMALKLDTSAFEKIAKADPPDFVKITTEPQATIATQLCKNDEEVLG